MSQQTLLEKAKQLPQKKGSCVAKQELELAVAWANSEVDLNQVRKAMNLTSTKLYVFLAYALKNYVSKNTNIHSLKLPSDKEILEYWENRKLTELMKYDYDDGAIDGAKWMRELIIQLNETL